MFKTESKFRRINNLQTSSSSLPFDSVLGIGRRCIFLVILIFISGCTEADWNAITETLNEISQNLEQQNVSSEKAIKIQKTQIIPVSFEKTAQIVSKAIEPTNSIVRNYAVNLVKKYPGVYNVPQICSIWYDLKENWRYVSDPRGQDYFAPANETIKVGLAGDCDDFAILMASLIEAIGGGARVAFTLNAKQGNHAYCEVFIGNTEQEKERACASILVHPKVSPYILVNWHESKKSGYWLNLDWSADYPGGPFFEASQLIFIYPNGNWQRIDVE